MDLSRNASQVYQVGVRLRVSAPQVLRQTIVIIVCRRLLHHLLHVPAFHYVVAGVGGGVRRARIPSRGRTLQPARRRAFDPTCPVRAAPRPEDREPLRDWDVATERHARAATKVPSVPQAPGFARRLQQAGLKRPVLNRRRRELVRLGTPPPDRGYAPRRIRPGVLLRDVSQQIDWALVRAAEHRKRRREYQWYFGVRESWSTPGSFSPRPGQQTRNRSTRQRPLGTRPVLSYRGS